MIGCYVTGILPRPPDLIEKTRAYERGQIGGTPLEDAFVTATEKAVKAQLSAGLDYATDGMLRWKDLLRPFAEATDGIEVGSLARWFNNNCFYRKPIITDDIELKEDVVKGIVCFEKLPKDHPWKAILPAPYTFAALSEDRYYNSEAELMFELAEIINKEMRSLVDAGFKYIQLSDPALVFNPSFLVDEQDRLALVRDALETAVKGISVETCLQTFFGNFSNVLPEAADFPVDHLGVDFHTTDLESLSDYSFNKGISLGLVDSRSSLVEHTDELIAIAKEIMNLVCDSTHDIFICPNCDLELLPWKRAIEKIKVTGEVTRKLRDEFYE